MKKKISIVIDAHNAAKFLHKCLRTLLAQKLSPDNQMEIIVSYEDSEEEKITEIIETFDDPRIKTAVVTDNGTENTYKLFLSYGYDKVSDDADYLYFIPAACYFKGTTFINDVLNRLNDTEDSVLLKNCYLENRNSVMHEKWATVLDEYFFATLIFKRNEYNKENLEWFFSMKVKNVDNFAFILLMYDKTVTGISPYIFDNKRENSIVFIIDDDGWCRTLLKYYLTVLKGNADSLKKKRHLVDALQSIDALGKLFSDYMGGRIRKSDIFKMKEEYADVHPDIDKVYLSFILFLTENDI